jgi:hypothetical protein
MKPGHELAELLEVDRAILVRLDVLPQADLRAVDLLHVGEGRCNVEAFRRQPARQRDLAGRVRRPRRNPDDDVARAKDVVGTRPERLKRLLDPMTTNRKGRQPHGVVLGETVGIERGHGSLIEFRLDGLEVVRPVAVDAREGVVHHIGLGAMRIGLGVIRVLQLALYALEHCCGQPERVVLSLIG